MTRKPTNLILALEIAATVVAVFFGIFFAYAVIFLGNPDNYR